MTKHLYERDYPTGLLLNGWDRNGLTKEIILWEELGYTVLVWGNSSIYPIYTSKSKSANAPGKAKA